MHCAQKMHVLFTEVVQGCRKIFSTKFPEFSQSFPENCTIFPKFRGKNTIVPSIQNVTTHELQLLQRCIKLVISGFQTLANYIKMKKLNLLTHG